MWRVVKFSMLVDHEKNALGDGYIVEFIHDATENYYEGETYACRNCNNIKFSLYLSLSLPNNKARIGSPGSPSRHFYTKVPAVLVI